MRKLKTNKKGFTILELVVVLAIAALIIVIVLLAVQALQRSQRTKAAQDAASRLLSQMQQWESDQGGATALGAAMGGAYVANANMGALATSYGTGAAATLAAPVRYASGQCGAGGITGAGGSSTIFSVAYWSETAGASVCIDTH